MTRGGKERKIEGNHNIGKKYMGNHNEEKEKRPMGSEPQKRQERLYDKDKNLST
jgi:hypothetical protein